MPVGVTGSYTLGRRRCGRGVRWVSPEPSSHPCPQPLGLYLPSPQNKPFEDLEGQVGSRGDSGQGDSRGVLVPLGALSPQQMEAPGERVCRAQCSIRAQGNTQGLPVVPHPGTGLAQARPHRDVQRETEGRPWKVGKVVGGGGRAEGHLGPIPQAADQSFPKAQWVPHSHPMPPHSHTHTRIHMHTHTHTCKHEHSHVQAGWRGALST